MLFELGKIVATPAALELMRQEGPDTHIALLEKHQAGQWGDLLDDDGELNNQAIKSGDRIVNAYLLRGVQKTVWVITEAVGDDGHRECTTFLLPSEY